MMQEFLVRLFLCRIKSQLRLCFGFLAELKEMVAKNSTCVYLVVLGLCCCRYVLCMRT